MEESALLLYLVEKYTQPCSPWKYLSYDYQDEATSSFDDGLYPSAHASHATRQEGEKRDSPSMASPSRETSAVQYSGSSSSNGSRRGRGPLYMKNKRRRRFLSSSFLLWTQRQRRREEALGYHQDRHRGRAELQSATSSSSSPVPPSSSQSDRTTPPPPTDRDDQNQDAKRKEKGSCGTATSSSVSSSSFSSSSLSSSSSSTHFHKPYINWQLIAASLSDPGTWACRPLTHSSKFSPFAFSCRTAFASRSRQEDGGKGTEEIDGGMRITTPRGGDTSSSLFSSSSSPPPISSVITDSMFAAGLCRLRSPYECYAQYRFLQSHLSLLKLHSRQQSSSSPQDLQHYYTVLLRLLERTRQYRTRTPVFSERLSLKTSLSSSSSSPLSHMVSEKALREKVRKEKEEGDEVWWLMRKIRDRSSIR